MLVWSGTKARVFHLGRHKMFDSFEDIHAEYKNGFGAELSTVTMEKCARAATIFSMKAPNR